MERESEADKLGKVIDDVMTSATSKDEIAGFYAFGEEKLDTEVDMEDGTDIHDNMGIQKVEIKSSYSMNKEKDMDKAEYNIEEVNIYAGAKLLNYPDFDKVNIPSQGKILTAKVHIVDGSFIATVDSSILFNKNVSIESGIDQKSLRGLTMMRGKMNLSDFTEEELMNKLDNLISNGIKIRVESEMGFDVDDLDTKKISILNNSISKIIQGHIVYNINFDNDYEKKEFTDRIKGISADLKSQCEITDRGDVKPRINLQGNILNDKEYFTVQGLLVQDKCGKELKDLMDVFTKVTLTDKNNREVDIRERKFRS